MSTYSVHVTLDIPETITYSGYTYTVWKIGKYAFANSSNLKIIKIPSTIQVIEEGAFGDNDSGSLSVNKIQKIEVASDNMYFDSRNGCNAVIKTENNHLIKGCKNTIIPDGIISISSYSFSRCDSLTSINIPNSVASIGEYAFEQCRQLEKVYIQDLEAWLKINFGGSYANPLFYSNHLYLDDDTEITNFVIPNDVTKIGDYTFIGCEALTSITIPNSVTSIGSGAFCRTQIKSVVFPNGLTSIGESAFQSCGNLEKIVIPNSVKSIGKNAFANCMNLYSVTSLINMPFKLDETAFQYIGSDYDKNIIYMAATLYVPRGRTAMYSSIDGWKKFLSIMETDTKFKLTYKVDGEVYKTYEIQATEVITPEPDPYKEGYIFSGWSEIPYLMPAEDVTITGEFTIDYNSAVDGIVKDETTPKAYYTIDGRRLSTSERGLNIVRMSDGTTRKVVVK